MYKTIIKKSLQLSLSLFLLTACATGTEQDNVKELQDELNRLKDKVSESVSPENNPNTQTSPIESNTLSGRIILPSGILIPSGILLPSRILMPSGVLLPSAINQFSIKQAGKKVFLGKGFQVEILDQNSQVIAQVIADENGQFNAKNIPANQRLQARAVLLKIKISF